MPRARQEDWACRDAPLRSYFVLRLLAEDRVLSDEHKAKVRALVEDWYRRDAGR
jgi:hypothetical protein